MLTEAEAKTKWCPLARVGNEAGCNRNHTDFGATAQCIASACMAWQAEPLEYEYGEPLPFGATPAEPGWEKNGETWYSGRGVTGEKRQRWRKPLPRSGYCGAFGKPSGVA